MGIVRHPTLWLGCSHAKKEVRSQLSIYVPICLSMYLSLGQSIHLHTRVLIYVSMYMFVYLSIYLLQSDLISHTLHYSTYSTLF